MDLPEHVPYRRLLDDMMTRVKDQMVRSYDTEMMHTLLEGPASWKWYTPR